MEKAIATLGKDLSFFPFLFLFKLKKGLICDQDFFGVGGLDIPRVRMYVWQTEPQELPCTISFPGTVRIMVGSSVSGMSRKRKKARILPYTPIDAFLAQRIGGVNDAPS